MSLIIVDGSGASARGGAAGGAQLAFEMAAGEHGRAVADDRPLFLRNGRFELARWAQADARRTLSGLVPATATDILNERVAQWAHGSASRRRRSPSRTCAAAGAVARRRAGSAFTGDSCCQPLDLADYVVVHELVHLRELNHGPAFWSGVGAVLPEYRERRKRLRSEGTRNVI